MDWSFATPTTSALCPASTGLIWASLMPAPSTDGCRYRLAARRCTHPGNGAGGEPRQQRVGAAGQDDRHTRAEYDTGGIRVRQERQALGQHVASLEVRNHEHVRSPCDRRYDPLDRCRFRTDRVIKREWAVQKCAGDLPPIRHFAECGSLDGGRNL